MLDYNFDLKNDRHKIQQKFPYLSDMMGSIYYGQDMSLITSDPRNAWREYLENQWGRQLEQGKAIPNHAQLIISDIACFLNEFTDEKEVDQILLRGFHSGFGLVHKGEPMGGLLKLKSQLEEYIKEHEHDY